MDRGSVGPGEHAKPVRPLPIARELVEVRQDDPGDLLTVAVGHKSAYALRDITKLIGLCAGHGENIGIYAERILDDPLPWTRMRAVYRLIGLVRQYGPDPAEAVCSKALDLDVIAVGKIDSMLAKAVENTPTLMPIAVAAGASRFACDPAEYTNQAARTAAARRPASTGSALASTGTGGSPCPPSKNSDQIWATPFTKAGRWIEAQ